MLLPKRTNNNSFLKIKEKLYNCDCDQSVHINPNFHPHHISLSHLSPENVDYIEYSDYLLKLMHYNKNSDKPFINLLQSCNHLQTAFSNLLTEHIKHKYFRLYTSIAIYAIVYLTGISQYKSFKIPRHVRIYHNENCCSQYLTRDKFRRTFMRVADSLNRYKKRKNIKINTKYLVANILQFMSTTSC